MLFYHPLTGKSQQYNQKTHKNNTQGFHRQLLNQETKKYCLIVKNLPVNITPIVRICAMCICIDFYVFVCVCNGTIGTVIILRLIAIYFFFL